MTPTQAESIAKGLLPCSLHEHCSSLKDKHFVDCPAHYRPDMARALVEAATLDRKALVELIYEAELDPPVFGLTRGQAAQLADAILSSNKTEGEGT